MRLIAVGGEWKCEKDEMRTFLLLENRDERGSERLEEDGKLLEALSERRAQLRVSIPAGDHEGIVGGRAGIRDRRASALDDGLLHQGEALKVGEGVLAGKDLPHHD